MGAFGGSSGSPLMNAGMSLLGGGGQQQQPQPQQRYPYGIQPPGGMRPQQPQGQGGQQSPLGGLLSLFGMGASNGPQAQSFWDQNARVGGPQMYQSGIMGGGGGQGGSGGMMGGMGGMMGGL